VIVLVGGVASIVNGLVAAPAFAALSVAATVNLCGPSGSPDTVKVPLPQSTAVPSSMLQVTLLMPLPGPSAVVNVQVSGVWGPYVPPSGPSVMVMAGGAVSVTVNWKGLSPAQNVCAPSGASAGTRKLMPIGPGAASVVLPTSTPP
jgi:hypothetical protein